MYRCSSTRSAGTQHGLSAQMRARRGTGNWARIPGEEQGPKLAWAVTLWEVPWRDYCSFLPKSLGRQQPGPLLLGRLLGSELEPP